MTGLLWAEQHGLVIVAAATNSARAVDGADVLQRGVTSRCNKLATACGVEKGQPFVKAAELLKTALWPHADVEAPVETRISVQGILCIDTLLGTSETTIW
jgi:hypothetical protein